MQNYIYIYIYALQYSRVPVHTDSVIRDLPRPEKEMEN
jgi:hypothetical protein